MKKVLFVMTFLIGSLLSKAQHVEFGIKGGLNIANLQQSKADYNAKLGIHGGFLAHIHLNKTWAIQPELVYSQEGAKYKSGTYNGKENLDYLNVPVLVQYMTKSGFRLETGPQIGFLINAKSEANSVSVDINKDRNSTNFSWAFGAGYLTQMGLGFDARFNAGLGNINDVKNNNPLYNSDKVRNSVVQLGVFYQFGKH